jgi:hypothetical protein
MLVADTNVLIELFLPGPNAEAVEQWCIGDPDWRLPSLWIFEFRHVQLKYLRAGRLALGDALNDLADAERECLPKTMPIASSDALRTSPMTMAAPVTTQNSWSLPNGWIALLLTFDRRLLLLFPEVALQPGS